MGGAGDTSEESYDTTNITGSDIYTSTATNAKPSDDVKYTPFFKEEHLYQYYDKEIQNQHLDTDRGDSENSDYDEEDTYDTILYQRSSCLTNWKDKSEVKTNDAVNDLSGDQILLHEMMFEMITSEASYFKSIDTFIDVFMKSELFRRMESGNDESKRDFQIIFSNIASIQETSENLLKELESHWKKDIFIPSVCKIVANHVEQHFKCYVDYCGNEHRQIKRLEYLCQNQNDFKTALTELEKHKACQEWGITSFIKLPMKRISRICTLTQKIYEQSCKIYGDNDEPRKHANCARKAAAKVVKICNTTAVIKQGEDDMNRVATEIKFRNKDEAAFEIKKEQRYLVRDADVTRIWTENDRTVKSEKLRLYIFNDKAVFTKKRKRPPYTVVDHCQLIALKCESVDKQNLDKYKQFLPQKVPKRFKFLLHLVILDDSKSKNSELMLSCKNRRDRKEWMKIIAPMQDSTYEPDLDWNKVFNFLVNIVCPRTYKLFYVELFGYGQHLLTQGKTINKTIENIELVHKGAATALYFDIFREWKNLMGSEARPEQIENALKQVGDNEALANFQLFMRNPPMIPAKMRSLLPLNEPDMSWTFPKIFDHFVTAPPQKHVMTLHNVNGSNDVRNLSEFQSFSKYKNSGVKGLIDQNANAANCLIFSTGSQTQIERQTNILQNINKRKWKSIDASDSSNDSGAEGPVCKLRKKSSNLNVMSISKRKQRQRTLLKRNLPYHCRKLVCWDKIGSEFVIDIIKRLLPTHTQELKSEEYYLFLHHTVSVIMKKAVVPERTVLAMTLNDFNNRFERKTERGHATCTIDTSQDVIMLGYEESECLKLYVEHARKRVIRKLKETNRDYVECEYVFIGYDGIPIVNKSFEDTIVKEIQSKRKALTRSILSQESVQNLNDHKHMRKEKILASEVQDMKMNHLSLAKTNLIGVSNYDEPKSTEGFSLPVEKLNDDRDEEMKDDEPICKGILKTSEGQDNMKIDDLCLGKEPIINVSKYDKSKSTEELSLTCEKIKGETMKNKNDKGEWYSMNALPTRPSKPGLPTRSPAGQSEKTTKSNSKTKLDPIELEEITVQNECLEDFIMDIDNFLASN